MTGDFLIGTSERVASYNNNIIIEVVGLYLAMVPPLTGLPPSTIPATLGACIPAVVIGSTPTRHSLTVCVPLGDQ